MNGTVMENDIIKCDSPPAHQWFQSENKHPFFMVEITLDGVLYGGPAQKFSYYKESQMMSITPNMGPKRGGTEVKIKGFGFNQASVCNMTI